MTEEIIITKTGISGQVKIFTTKVEEVIEKKLNFLKIPKPKQKWADGPEVKIIDLLLITRQFNIEGSITQFTVGGDTAQQQRDKLWDIIKAGGTATVAYRGNNYTIGFQKCSMNEISADEDTPSSYDVTLNVIEGVDR